MSTGIVFTGQSNVEANGALIADLSGDYAGLATPVTTCPLSVDIDWPIDGTSPPTYTRGWGDLEPVASAAGDFGPELSMGRVLDAYIPGEFRIIKSCRGSTSMDEWEPGRTATHRLFDRTKARVDERLAEVVGGCTVGAWVMIQGTNDANVFGDSKDYAGKMANFINVVRGFYGDCLPFVLAMLHPSCLYTAQHVAHVRQGQLALQANMHNVTVVDCKDLYMSFNHYQHDIPIVGTRVGNAVVSLLSGQTAQPLSGWTCGVRI